MLDDESKKAEKLFLSFMIITKSVLFLFIILNLMTGKLIAMNIDIGTTVLLIATSFYYRKTGNLKYSLFAYLNTVVLLTSTQHFIAPNYLSSNILFLPVWVLIAYNLLSKKLATAVALSGAILYSLAYLIPMYFAVPVESVSLFDANITNIITIMIVTFSIYYISSSVLGEEKVIQVKIQKGYDKLREISETNAALTTLVTHDIATPLMLMQHYSYSMIEGKEKRNRFRSSNGQTVYGPIWGRC